MITEGSMKARKKGNKLQMERPVKTLHQTALISCQTALLLHSYKQLEHRAKGTNINALTRSEAWINH